MKRIKKELNAVSKKDLFLTIITTAAFVILSVVILLINTANPVGYSAFDNSYITYEKGVVTAVLEENTAPADGFPERQTGFQRITVQFMNGSHKGLEVEIINNLSITHNVSVKKGTRVVVRAERPDNVPPNYSLQSYDRTWGIVVAVIIFAAVMIIICRRKGVRGILGLAVSMFFIFAFLLPSIFRGDPPIFMAVLTSILISVFSLILLNGFTQKTFTALLATVSSILISGLFFLTLSAILKLSGYDIHEVEDLIMVSRATGLRIREILFAGILIASVGAVMDMAVSVSSSMYEVLGKQPDMPKKAWFKSGMNIGRDIAGSMCQTLILAFIGSTLAMALLIMTYSSDIDKLLSSEYVAVEIVQGLTGALAVTTAAPLTAAICTFFREAAKEHDGKPLNKSKPNKQ